MNKLVKIKLLPRVKDRTLKLVLKKVRRFYEK